MISLCGLMATGVIVVKEVIKKPIQEKPKIELREYFTMPELFRV